MLGFPAAALTDRNGLYAAMAFSDAAAKDGVQPIIGAMLGLARPDLPEGVEPPIDWLALYAQDETGYRNLCALVSMAHLDRPIEQAPHVTFAVLVDHAHGLLCLTAGGEGGLARLLAEDQPAGAAAYADRLQALFGDRLFVELARRGDAVEQAAEDALIDLAYARSLRWSRRTRAASPKAVSATRMMPCCASPAPHTSRARIARAPRPTPG